MELQKDIMDMLSDIENKYLSWRIEGSDIANINENASESEPVMPSKWTYSYLENVLDLARKKQWCIRSDIRPRVTALESGK